MRLPWRRVPQTPRAVHGLIDADTAPDHPRLSRLVLIAVAGVSVSIMSAQLGAMSTIPRLEHDPGLIGIGLTLGAILLIPPSILAAGVGAMFPRYDRATPVTLVNDPTYGLLLGSVTFDLFLGVSIQVLGLQTSVLPLALFAVVLALALLMAVWLIGHSLAVLDPDRMSVFLADRALRHPFFGPLLRPDPNQPFKDLCRLDTRLPRAPAPERGSQCTRPTDAHMVCSGWEAGRKGTCLGWTSPRREHR